MNVVLMMFREHGEPRSFSLTRDVTVVGRREDADFRIPLTDVSRKHCRFIKDGDTLILEDLGSSNGTFRNGERIKDVELEPGDTIQIGPVQFVVQINGVPSEDEMLGKRSSATREASPNGADPRAATFTPPPPPPPPSILQDLTDIHGDNPTVDEDDVLVDFDFTGDSKA